MTSFLKHVREWFRAAGGWSGRWLVLDAPRRSDLIVVLAGAGICRAQRAFELLRQGFGEQILLSATTGWQMFGHSEYDLALAFLAEQPQDVRRATRLAPLPADSTAEEALYVGSHVRALGARSILLVTSDFHTRRALSIYRRLLPDVQSSISAAVDADAFGACWWQHRHWAKTFIGELVRLLWWKAVDRFRLGCFVRRPPAGLARRLQTLLHRHS